MEMSPSLMVSLISASAAIISAIVARLALENQRRVQSIIIDYDLWNRAHELLIKDRELLRMLGIEPEMLDKDGITSDILLFIDLNMSAGHAMYRISGKRKPEITPYRRNILSNPKVRLIWKKYLHGKLYNETPWTRAIDDCIADLEARGSNTLQ
jgi:hypothetical protein